MSREGIRIRRGGKKRKINLIKLVLLICWYVETDIYNISLLYIIKLIYGYNMIYNKTDI